MIDWLITQQEYVDGQVEKSAESAQGTHLPTIILSTHRKTAKLQLKKIHQTTRSSIF